MLCSQSVDSDILQNYNCINFIHELIKTINSFILRKLVPLICQIKKIY